jgi:hypothetical protein
MQIAPTIVIDASLTAIEGFENRLSIVRPGRATRPGMGRRLMTGRRQTRAESLRTELRYAFSAQVTGSSRVNDLLSGG